MWNLPLAKKSVIVEYPAKLICQGIAAVLREAGFAILGQFESVHLLMKVAVERRPDIVLLGGQIAAAYLETVHTLKENLPGAVIVVLSEPQSAGEDVLPAINAGASGCLSPNLSSEEFVQSLRLLAAGDMVVSRDMASGVKANSPQLLSEREREVMALVGDGATNREIGHSLFISENTVKAHVRTIMTKLDVRNRNARTRRPRVTRGRGCSTPRGEPQDALP